jgi:hypothetical protein
MAASFGKKLSSELITSIKKRASIPESQKTYEDDDVLRFANEEIDNTLLPFILRTKEEFYVRTETAEESPLSTPSVRRYKIPYRAVGSKLRNVFMESSTGNRKQCTRLQPEVLGGKVTDYYSSESNVGFYLEGDDLVFPTGDQDLNGQQVKLSYYMKPNDLVTEDRVPSVTRIETSGIYTNIYLTSLPDHFLAGETVDFIGDQPNHRTLAYDIELTDVNDNVSGEVRVTILAADLPSELAVNDHVALAGETKVPQIPSDLHAVLAQAAACRILEAQGDANVQKAEQSLQTMLNNTVELIDTRTEGNPQKIVNTGGFLRKRRIF